MKRLHIHISVDDLAASERFYSTIFGQAPSRREPDYLKWEVEDPRVNFAISRRGNHEPGINHLGIQTDTDAELSDLHRRLASAGQATVDEADTTCCYARSRKHWATDPQGVAWEMFRTMETSLTYGAGPARPAGTDTGRDAPVTPAKGCC